MENPTPSRPALPARFRKWDLEQRRSAVLDVLRDADMDRGELAAALGTDGDLADLADVLVESAIGYFGLPLAVCRGVVVDGDSFDVPLVTEEPSVVAAATFAAGIVRRSGGFRTWGGDPVTTGQVFLENATTEAGQAVLDAEDTLVDALAPVLAGMKARGGGYRGMDVRWLPGTRLLRVQFNVDVRDAMGANIVNTAMETIRPMLERITGGRCLMAILTNEARQRITGAEFSVPVASLTRGGAAGDEMARRIALAGELAQEDASRAVTHNKGVMNGITALMLATGNDTRAVEAAVHLHASSSGSYRGVTTYRVRDNHLRGRIEVPLPVGTVGGSAGTHPTSRLSLALLGNPNAVRLARIAAAVGLAQNFAAVSALVAEGIQTGHMALHARRLAWLAGARGPERDLVAAAMTAGGVFNREAADLALRDLRSRSAGGDTKP